MEVSGLNEPFKGREGMHIDFRFLVEWSFVGSLLAILRISQGK
jgi:hypothetical protein